MTNRRSQVAYLGRRFAAYKNLVEFVTAGEKTLAKFQQSEGPSIALMKWSGR